ncbi:hypothetical protein KIN20_013932 [Parelaphostrongylus tenuis]|uniref:Uncharacterized protein n=1 Tax=Parelaphostrongylus tenuis TaxID=148309 RepID=A0AAD5MWR8_PARTN|nr:hypothetical protein KIN20_013932 [Parelaphostrongylus tenuis]
MKYERERLQHLGTIAEAPTVPTRRSPAWQATYGGHSVFNHYADQSFYKLYRRTSRFIPSI